MNILGFKVEKKELIQIACITAIILILATFSFQHMTKLGEELAHESIPMFIFFALLTVTLIGLGFSTHKWFFWLKNPKFNREIFFSIHFFIWFVIVSEILLATATYYTYYNYPDFQYGFIFDIAGVSIIILLLYFLVRTVYEVVIHSRKSQLPPIEIGGL